MLPSRALLFFLVEQNYKVKVTIALSKKLVPGSTWSRKDSPKMLLTVLHVTELYPKEPYVYYRFEGHEGTYFMPLQQWMEKLNPPLDPVVAEAYTPPSTS